MARRWLEADKGTNYSTTVKMLSVMLRKGLLKREEESQPHIYHPVLSRKKAGKRMVHELIDKVYGGSVMSLVLQALSSGKATKEELKDVKVEKETPRTSTRTQTNENLY
jgi:predicted transcriptional regulator